MNSSDPKFQTPSNQPVRQPWLPKFGIAEMMLGMMILCVMGAAFSYARLAFENHSGRPIFVIFTLAAPIALVLILSAYRAMKKWLQRL